MNPLAEVIAYWKEQSQYDIETAQSLFETAKYPYALFMCHLAVEKILKGIIVETASAHAPYTHNLIELAGKTTKKFSDAHMQPITELNEFNLEARYPDWKRDFYKKATREFTADYLTGTNALLVWLQQ